MEICGHSWATQEDIKMIWLGIFKKRFIFFFICVYMCICLPKAGTSERQRMVNPLELEFQAALQTKLGYVEEHQTLVTAKLSCQPQSDAASPFIITACAHGGKGSTVCMLTSPSSLRGFQLSGLHGKHLSPQELASSPPSLLLDF